ncbi:MAG TPA: ABC transporter permease [Thermomicrobiales bacterium]|nr:ABC transporter permease [Thermomicrobiales bacterium]
MFGSNDPLDFIDWIRDNPDQFWELLREHAELVFYAVGIALVIAVPLAVVTSRIKVLERPMTWVANIGQAIPNLAVLGLVLPWLGIGFRPSLFALTILAILPIFLNTLVGIVSVDPAVVDAARGMGTTDFQLLRMVQLPLAMPFMFAGLQTAVVQSIGLATLAAYIGGGGFGDWILQGLAMNSYPLLLAGAVPVAVMAMSAEILLGLARRTVVPKGLTVAD